MILRFKSSLEIKKTKFTNSEAAFHLLSIVFYLLKVLLFFLGVGIVEAHDELPFKRELVVLVEQRSLGMANMQVSEHMETEKKTPVMTITKILMLFF